MIMSGCGGSQPPASFACPEASAKNVGSFIFDQLDFIVASIADERYIDATVFSQE